MIARQADEACERLPCGDLGSPAENDAMNETSETKAVPAMTPKVGDVLTCSGCGMKLECKADCQCSPEHYKPPECCGKPVGHFRRR